MKAVRLVAGLVVLVMLGTLVAQLAAPPPPAQPAGEFTSSEQCKECHAQEYEEWIGSAHANSWNNPDVYAQSNGFENKDCIDCHAPRPVFETGLGNRVLPRSSRRSEGVDCISCHMLPDGNVAGTIDNARAACRPVTRRELQRVDYCGVCHNQHKTVDQWRKTHYAENNIGCIDCHMPHRDGDPNKGRSHVMPGGHDIDVVRSAVRWKTERAGDRIVVELENHAGGHAFPTDERSRASDIWWRVVGTEDWNHLHRIRDPYRYETDIPRTLLDYGEVRTLEIEDAPADPVEVMWVYKLTPYYRLPETGDPIEIDEVIDPLMDSRELFRAVVE